MEEVQREEESRGRVGNNNEGDTKESVEEEEEQEQEEQEEGRHPTFSPSPVGADEEEEGRREVQGGMEVLEREDDNVDDLLDSFEEDTEEEIVLEEMEADDKGMEETCKGINRGLETMVEKVDDGQGISYW